MSEFPSLEFVHIITPVGTTYLRQRQAQMKSVEPTTRMPKRPRGDASTTFGAKLAAKETYVDLMNVVDLAGRPKDVDPSRAPPLSLQAMLQSIMTTQATQGHLLDELLTEVASL